MKKKRIIVVGAGVGGLAAGALLANRGFSVTILEKNPEIGGRARKLELKGFTFDMGPSWYMMPEVFENFFKLFKKNVADFYELKRLDINYRVFFDDQERIDIYANLKKNLKTFKNLEPNGDKKLLEILRKAEFIYTSSMKELVFEDYSQPLKLIKRKILTLLWRFDLFRSLHQYISNKISNKKLQKILEYTTVFLGGSPYNTPAFYQLVAHADFNLGIFYPRGGIHKIVEGLKKLALENFVTIKTNEEVVSLKITDDKVTSVISKKREYSCDYVVVNADYPYFETKILPKKYQTYGNNFWQKKTFSPSAFILYLGINHPLPLSQHHNLFFTDNWEEHFYQVYKKPSIPTNPSFYWHVPSKSDPRLAPKNSHSVMILVPMPPNLFLNQNQTSKFYEKIIEKFAFLNKARNLKKYIAVKKIFQAENFLRDYNSTYGSAFGLAHTLFQTAIFRPKNFSKKIKNLFYVGHHTNPGVGLPPVLISAQIVSRLIEKNEKK